MSIARWFLASLGISGGMALALMACTPASRVALREPTTLDASARSGPAESREGDATSLVLRPARILDVQAGEYLPEGAVVVIEGGQITHVGAAEEAPPGAEVVALPNLTLLPGFIDAHTHLLHLTDPLVRNDSDSMVIETTGMSDAERALRGARYAREMLHAGFTSVRDLGNSGAGADLALRDAIAAGSVEGPTMFVTTRALAGARGQFGRRQWRLSSLIEHEYRVISGVEEARRATREAIAAGADGVKVIVGSETAITLSLVEVATIVEEAHGAGRWVAAHCTDDAAARIAVEAGVDSIDHGYEIEDDTMARMAAEGIPLVPTDYPLAFFEFIVRVNPYVPEQHREAIHGAIVAQRDEAVARLRRAVTTGVPIVMGSDAYYPWDEQTRGEIAASVFVAYAEAGLPPLEVIRATTTNAARLLRRADRIGALRTGFEADIVGVEGDPLADVQALRAVRFVMKDGEVARGPGDRGPNSQEP